MEFIRRAIVYVVMFSTLFALNLIFTCDQALAETAACQQIRKACKDAGFVLGGGARDGLLVACYNPIVNGTAQPRLASIPLPTVDPQVVQACKGGKEATPGAPTAPAPPPANAPLEPAADGQTVYDPSLNITWLADANLAGKETFGVTGINKSGSMDYPTALRWVAAMNASKYLGHSNWQIPTAPMEDKSCARTGRNGESFGFNCSGSALGSLYYASIGLNEPDTAVPIVGSKAGPFTDFQPYLYWSGSAALDPKQGFVSFSFNSGFQGANVVLNYLYVVPVIRGKLPGTPVASGSGLQLNPDGKTAYDPVAQVTWLTDANLAATQTFGVAGVNPDGAMDHATAVQWIAAMNKAKYLGQANWELPETGPPDATCNMKGITGFGCTGSAMGELYYKQLGLKRGESVVAVPDVTVGPMHDIQPYLYWACEAESAASACQDNGPAEGFEWNFSFGNGFEGTNLVGNNLYVMVYYVGSDTKAAGK